MSDLEPENGEDAIDETGRNPTQQRLDEEGTEPVPVDVDWEKVPVERVESAISGEERE
jgi:hypothetical protein